MSFSFNWGAYGDLNPVSQKTFGARYDSQISTYEDMSIELQESHYSSDALSKRTEWIGIVLRVEGRTTEPNNFLDATEKEPRKRTHIRIKVRVPELHAQVSEPRSPNDHYVIDLHPTYTAAHNRLPVPRVGDRVLVSHLGSENLNAPIYKEYLEDKAGKLNIGRTRKSARNCLEYAPGLGCLQRKAGSDGKIDISLFPAPRGSLKPKSSNSSAFLIGDSQMTGRFGKVFEAYLKHHGWSVKRNARAGSAVKHWRKKGKNKQLEPNPPGFQLKGFLDDGLATKPELVIISLGGNSNYGSNNPPGTPAHNTWIKHFKTRTIDLARQCLESAGTVMWFGAPPTVNNSSEGYPPRHDWNVPGYYRYREVINTAIDEALKTFSEYNKTLFFINPIGTSDDGYAGKDKYLPNYEGPGGDGIHLTQAAAVEYIKIVAGEERGTSLTSIKSPAQGAKTSKSPTRSVDPFAALLAAKKEKAELELVTPEEDQDKERIKELTRDIRKYEKMPKAITAKQREEYLEKLMKINEEMNIKRDQLAAAAEMGEDTASLSDELDILEDEAKAIEELLAEDDKASKPVPCDPCTPGNKKNTTDKYQTEPLALNWEEAKKDGNKNATKYIRAFIRMISIAEGGRKSWGNVSAYNLCVGGTFIQQRKQGSHPKTTDPNKAHRLGPKTPAGNSFVGYEGGHPRLLFKFTDRYNGQVDKKGNSIEWKNNSTAAGRYQFMENTWFGKGGRPGWGKKHTPDENDFSPINQDRAVVNFLASRGIKKILEDGGDNFVTPTFGGKEPEKEINEGRDKRPATITTMPEVTGKKGTEPAKPTNLFEQRFFEAVGRVKEIWASLPGAPYAGQKTSKSTSQFLNWYKHALAQEIEAEEAGKDTSEEPVET